MPYVQVPKDLNKVKTKVVFNLTKRQLIWFSAAAFTAVPVYFLTRSHIGNTLAMLLLIIISMPFFLMAMYEKNGLPFEKNARIFITSRFIRPKKRPYRTENIYEYAQKQYDLEKEVNNIVYDKNKAHRKTEKNGRRSHKKGSP
ncbi:PrgI family protein [Ruminococcus sp.]|uniref:PrgI family protein n=1 Tax=Ruminococcus sp. TaxID=41978 RepID=UPI0025F6B3F7|nr:PrgI family protein [Ruminococcus sp.]